jgi:tRNA threonylcarbamoyladenosine biosynthesis protein TsaB
MPRAVGHEQVLKPDQLLDDISGETLFVGNGALVYRSLIVRVKAGKAHFAPAYLNLPRASSAAALALHNWNSGEVFSADELMPNYLRPSEAELNLRNKEKSRNSS